MSTLRRCPALVSLVMSCVYLVLPLSASADPVIGQVDTFEDGTTMGWRINLLGMGSPPAEALPVNVPTGGPGGADDNFLQLTSLGTSTAGGRLVAINLDSRWTGDYLAAGVDAIAVDVNNLGTSDLALRLLFEKTDGGPPTDIALSADPVLLAAGSGWTRVTFHIALDDLVAIEGDVEAALRGVGVLRLFHSTTAVFPGEPVTAVLGVDNITAVPEPGACGLLALGLAGLAWRLGRRGR